MANETRGIVKESHVYSLFGVEIAKCIVKEHDISREEYYRKNDYEPTIWEKEHQREDEYNEKHYSEGSEVESKREEPTIWEKEHQREDEYNEKHYSKGSEVESKRKTDWTKAVVLVFAVAAFCYLIYNPPSVLDNMINVIMRDCPEKAQLDDVQTSLSRCQSQLQSTAVTMTKCTLEKSELGSHLEETRQVKRQEESKLAKARSDLDIVETKLGKTNEELMKIRESNEDYQKKLEYANNEKERISKNLDEAQLRYGTCKNKNMDHEVSNAALLTDIEKLKKQLEKC